MKESYDFSKGKRGAVIPTEGKTRITIYLDNDVLDGFRARAAAAGIGYQTLINESLRLTLDDTKTPLTAELLRQILHEELHPVM